ncbi:ATP-binding protein [Desulfosporosinus sp. Sb-LF]|uniref:ATP-binding protein n=1 Tax=Desulfosporosinus sp. Sb-LF TaxID=2560027 RepID=UPI00107F8155|nr:ATP-binding protein [Desulfosporosinus sp. Sb-LF]TGE33486.1 ATP-binding protein [Desulfosporosinus sp. Sb-LF]
MKHSNHSQLTTTLLALDSLSIYRGLLEDRVLSRLRDLLICLDHKSVKNRDGEFRRVINSYNDFYFELAKSGTISLTDYIVDKLIFDENPFSFKMQTLKINDSDTIFENSVSNDLRCLQIVSQLNPTMVKTEITELYKFKDTSFDAIIEGLPNWVLDGQSTSGLDHIKQLKKNFLTNRWDFCIDQLKDFHQSYGCGLFARYRAFVWERSDGHGYLKGIDSPDPITLDELIDYQNERSRVLENTLQFLKGFPANNVLLYGDRGTGKSSTVKAILTEYHTQGLRMLEVPKAYLADFPLIIRQLKDRTQKFVIFIDDLVFGDNEENYTSLKAVLEGGLESKTPNILIYATSNRRHLVKEYFNERAGLQSNNHDEEVHAGDTMQEKLSLADRFGLNIVFSSPDQKKYLAIVQGIAARRNLKIDQERLQKKALQWALSYNGRSARTAKQFVDWIEGHDHLKNQ